MALVLMERIVRPHLPEQPDPTQQKPQCRQAPTPTPVKIPAPSLQAQQSAQQNQPNPVPQSHPVERVRTSSWSYGYKCYMTKQEREQKTQDDPGADDPNCADYAHAGGGNGG